MFSSVGHTTAHSPQPDGKYASVTMQSDAVTIVEDLFSRQVELSIREGTPINTVITGDTEARAAFWLLLNMDVQRSVFLTRCKTRDFLPRIRTLVGSPPFSFLHPEDDFILNASGITGKRVHMAPSERGPILSSSEIADGHFVDRCNRTYKVVAVDYDRRTHLRPNSTASVYRSLTSGHKIIIDLKLPRMSQAERMEIHKSTRIQPKGSIHFPNPGDNIQISINSKLYAPSLPSEYAILVKSVRQRNTKSPVCRLCCVVD